MVMRMSFRLATINMFVAFWVIDMMNWILVNQRKLMDAPVLVMNVTVTREMLILNLVHVEI